MITWLAIALPQNHTLNYQRRNYLWHGLVDDAIILFDELNKKQAKSFQNYLRKHSSRIPDYQLYQQLGICIGSGSALVLD